MDEHAAHADAPEEQDVLGQRPVELGVDRRPPELHDHCLAAEALDVGQRLNKYARGLGRGHDVFTFSLM